MRHTTKTLKTNLKFYAYEAGQFYYKFYFDDMHKIQIAINGFLKSKWARHMTIQKEGKTHWILLVPTKFISEV